MSGWQGEHYVVDPVTPSQWLAKYRDPQRCPGSGARSCDYCAMPGCADPPVPKTADAAATWAAAALQVQGRYFASGAYRDTNVGKLDYEGFLSPLVLERFAQYMEKHRHQSDGAERDSDNWQRGIPRSEYMKSGLRHVFDWWKEHRGLQSRDGLEDALCGVMFNAMGYLLEVLKERGPTHG